MNDFSNHPGHDAGESGKRPWVAPLIVDSERPTREPSARLQEPNGEDGGSCEGVPGCAS